jgi:transcriptional regulator with XRE-family HTH domain
LDRAVSNLRAQLTTYCAGRHLSVRAAAKEMGVSFSALARFVRGETQVPGPHMDLAIQRFLGKETLPCPCSRCQGRSSLEARIERLEDDLCTLKPSVAYLLEKSHAETD